MTRICPTVVVLAALAMGASHAHAAEVFVHSTSTANTRGSASMLQHPSLDNQPNARVFVAQVYGTYNKNPVGVRYARGRWSIVNMNDQPLPKGTKFNVLVVSANDDSAFVHRATPRNNRGNQTVLSHASVARDPRVMPIVTARRGIRQTEPLGIWWDGKVWTIYNQTRKAMPPGAEFNVLAARVGDFPAFGARGRVHQVTPANKTHGAGRHVSKLDLTDPKLVIFAMAAYGQKGPYNEHELGVWHDGKSWTVFNEDHKDLPDGLHVNLLVVDPTRLRPSPPPPAGPRPTPLDRTGLPGGSRPSGNPPPPPPRGQPAPSRNMIGPLTFHAQARRGMCMHKRPGVWGHGTRVFIRPCQPNRRRAQGFVFDSAQSLIRSVEDNNKCMYTKGQRAGGAVYFDTCGQKNGDIANFIYDGRSHIIRPRDNPNLCVRMANATFADRTHLLLGQCSSPPRDASGWSCTPGSELNGDPKTNKRVRQFCN